MLIILDVLGEKKEIFKPYQFKMEEIEGFRYRAQVSAVSCSRMLPWFRSQLQQCVW